jgi:hypothetical protein
MLYGVTEVDAVTFGLTPVLLCAINLQDLVTLEYLGAPPGTSVNDFVTFQGQPLAVCQNGASLSGAGLSPAPYHSSARHGDDVHPPVLMMSTGPGETIGLRNYQK